MADEIPGNTPLADSAAASERDPRPTPRPPARRRGIHPLEPAAFQGGGSRPDAVAATVPPESMAFEAGAAVPELQGKPTITTSPPPVRQEAEPGLASLPTRGSYGSSPSEPYVTLSIRVPERLRHDLKRASVDRRIPMQDLVAQACASFLQQTESSSTLTTSEPC